MKSYSEFITELFDSGGYKFRWLKPVDPERKGTQKVTALAKTKNSRSLEINFLSSSYDRNRKPIAWEIVFFG